MERDRIIELLNKKEVPYSEYNGREKSFDNFKNNETYLYLFSSSPLFGGLPYRAAVLPSKAGDEAKACRYYPLR